MACRRALHLRLSHDQPLTPSERLLRWSGLTRQDRQRIGAMQKQCDPLALLETIRSNQFALVNGGEEPAIHTPGESSH